MSEGTHPLHRNLSLATPPMRGHDVRELQHLLAAFGVYHGKVDGVYDVLTAQAVYRAKYRLGYPHSDLNHRAGPVIEGFLTGHDHPTKAMVKLAHERAKKKPVGVPKARQMLEFELTQVGTHERPPGSNLQKYGAAYGENGVPWCAIFQSYAAAHVGLHFHYAYVPYVVADARAGRNGLILLHPSQAFPGCLACFDWDHDGVADHIGCFRHPISREQFATVEGNTAIGNDSNGGEVLARTDRYYNEVIAFVKIAGST